MDEIILVSEKTKVYHWKFLTRKYSF